MDDNVTKRVVFLETQGPHAGLHHILGCDDEFNGAPLPDFADGVEVHGRMTAASLIQVKTRYVLYREVLRADDEMIPTA